MSTTYAYTSTLVVVECCTCHMDFGMLPDFDRQKHNDRTYFYCPAGHPQHYTGQNEAEQLRRQLDAARSLAKREAERRQHTEYQRRAAVGQVTKIKRRIGRGVCPCCNRTFADLARHMAGQHPEFADTEGATT